jgi:flagellar FliJ protein
MKRFKWNLQRLLDVKIRQEELKKGQLLALIQNIAAVRQSILIRQTKLRQMLAELAARQPAERLSQQQLFLKAVAFADEQIEKLKNQLKELGTQRTAMMAEVLELRRFRKSLEKLRAVARQEYDLEVKKFEQQNLDEAAGIAFARESIENFKIQEVLSTV